MFKSYKYRIYPTEPQRQLIEKTFGCVRLVYNLGLQVRIEAWRSAQVSITGFGLGYQLKDLKKECPFLKEVDLSTLEHSVQNTDRAYKNFWKHNSHHPKFKSKHSKNVFQAARRVKICGSLLTIPKIKNIPIVLSREIEGKIKSATITKSTTGKYFASILVETPALIPAKPEIKNAIGLDVGLKYFAVTSEGLKYENPKYLRNTIDRLKILQRRASRKKKGSANRKKANLRVAILHEKIANRRSDFLHKLTTQLTRDNQTDTYVIEDLNVKGMTANHNLAQAINDVSWSKFRELLTYKCEWYGKNLLVIDRFAPSSKTCSVCGNVKDLTLADRVYKCHNCGLVIDRDINAAINIKEFGLSGLGKSGGPVESLAVAGTMKEELYQDRLPHG